MFIVYALDLPGEKKCTIGLINTITKSQSEVIVHQYAPSTDGRLRVEWKALYVTTSEAEHPGVTVTDPTNAKPVLEHVPARRIIAGVQMMKGVVLEYSMARKSLTPARASLESPACLQTSVQSS